VKLALNVIFKDEVHEAERILFKYSKYFDEICFAVDQKIDEFKKFETDKIKIFPYDLERKMGWVDEDGDYHINFAHKRNFLASKTKSEYYLRIDSDDDIENPEIIRECFNDMLQRGSAVTYVPYIYSKDEDNNCNAKHFRETIVKKVSDIYWKKKIHENLFIVDQNKYMMIKTDKIRIIHNLTPEHAEESAKRNLKALLAEFKEDKKNTDPRTLGYIGRVYMGLGKWKEAIPFLELLIEKSGWDDDKYFAYTQLADCLQELGNSDMAIAACNEALAINTKFPNAYIKLGQIWLDRKDYEKALDWLMPGIVRPEPDTMFVIDPSIYTRGKINVAVAYFQKGDYQMAFKYLMEVKKESPSNDFVKKNERIFAIALNNNMFLKDFMAVTKYIELNDKDKLPALMNDIPKNMLQDERMWALKHKFGKTRKWPKKSIAIFCGSSWETWNPSSVLKGIGGSEEAVIYIAPELVKLGYHVEVFNNCGDFYGEYEGVKYRNHFEFNPYDEFDNVIAWRNNIFRTGEIKARNKVVWLHDVPHPGWFAGDEHKCFDKIMVLSEYHKSLLNKDIPEDKIFVSSNGINAKDFVNPGVKRNPKRLIYTSSYDRGIEHLLRMWPDVLKEVPDAELHLYYGWNTFDSIAKNFPHMAKIKAELSALMNQKNVFEHGRIGHKQLIKEFYKSGIFVYPSHFEEISCISAMKAQACNCYPVTTDYAALSETNKSDFVVEGKCGEGTVNERYKKALIDTLKNPKEYKCDYDFSWKGVASTWQKSLLK
jgi:glycosyltransferase involved in cell wall biosynthesis